MGKWLKPFVSLVYLLGGSTFIHAYPFKIHTVSLCQSSILKEADTEPAWPPEVSSMDQAYLVVFYALGKILVITGVIAHT